MSLQFKVFAPPPPQQQQQQSSDHKRQPKKNIKEPLQGLYFILNILPKFFIHACVTVLLTCYSSFQ